MGRCHLCHPPANVPDDELLLHLRVEHDQELDFETWPDGELVVHDTTLEPDEFTRQPPPPGVSASDEPNP